MNKKHYKLIALAILIGSPVIVNVLSRVVPDQHDVQPIEIAPGAPPRTAPMARLPTPLPPPPRPEATPGENDPIASAMPMLDTSGQSAAPRDSLAAPMDEPVTATPVYTQSVPVQAPNRSNEQVATAQPAEPPPPGPPIPMIRTSNEGPASLRH